jgi:hypothetical protein
MPEITCCCLLPGQRLAKGLGSSQSGENPHPLKTTKGGCGTQSRDCTLVTERYFTAFVVSGKATKDSLTAAAHFFIGTKREEKN